jgi:hypothetical protein
MWCRIPSWPSSPWTSCRRTRHSAPGCSGSPTTARWTCCAVIGKLPGSGCSASGRRRRWSRGDGRRVRRSAGWWRRWLRAGSRNHGRIAGDVAEYNRAHESYCRCSIPTTAPAVAPSSSTAPRGSAGDVASMGKLPLRHRNWTYRCDAATDANASSAGGPLARLFRLHGVNKDHKSELRSPPAQL